MEVTDSFDFFGGNSSEILELSSGETYYGLTNASSNIYGFNSSMEGNSSEIIDPWNTTNITKLIEKNDFGQHVLFPNALWIQFIFSSVLLTMVSILGILGNLLSVYVLAQKKMRSSLSVLLIGLSFCDFLVCLVAILLFSSPTIFKKLNILLSYLDWFCDAKKYLFLLMKTAQTGSTYFTVAITFERYIAVCKPLQSRNICTYQKARYYSAVVVLFSLLVNGPWYYEYINRDEVSHVNNHTCESGHTLQRNETESAFATALLAPFRSFFFTIFMFLVPMITVIVVNGIIIKTIKQKNVERETMTQNQIKQIKLTKMLIVVVAVYVICNMFRVINVVTKNVFNITYAEFASFTNFLVTFNSAVNYLIYCAFGRTFRESFITLFCKCGKRKRTFKDRKDANEGITNNTITTDLSMFQSNY